MKKLAFYVEGMTECLFVEQLVRQFIPRDALQIRIHAKDGAGPKYTIQKDGMDHAAYKVFIRNCEGDATVVSQLREDFENLADQGFNLVVGVRDLYREPLSRAGNARQSHDAAVSNCVTLRCRARIVLCVHETEAFFIGDPSHFGALSSLLTSEVIEEELGPEWRSCDLESIDSPASRLKRLYNRGGFKYDKSYGAVTAVTGRLCYTTLYCEARRRAVALNQLFEVLEEFYTCL